ncbi:MAG: hypothetical protein EBZ74_04790 [Planctomycetia bacterium]|nr:hypothetical protein [Planctomycetia bacterium]
MSSRALGLEAGTAAASERITLGVIRIGGRCRYVLGSMMTLPDVQCVAIADVQAFSPVAPLRRDRRVGICRSISGNAQHS